MADYAQITFMMKFVLQDLAPLLQLDGDDNRIYAVADRDLRLYIQWLYRDKELDEYDALIENELDEQDVGDFVKLWTSQWWKKYQERTKVVVNNEETKRFNVETKKINANSKNLWKQVTPKERAEMIRHVAFTLIRNGEPCCLEIIAENLFMQEYNNLVQRGHTTLTPEDKINMTNIVKQRAKRVSYTHGPLVFIKYNHYKLREFRNDGEEKAKPK